MERNSPKWPRGAEGEKSQFFFALFNHFPLAIALLQNASRWDSNLMSLVRVSEGIPPPWLIDPPTHQVQADWKGIQEWLGK